MISGKFFISVFTMVSNASITAGTRLGSKLSNVSRTSENKLVTIVRNVGSKSPTASIMASTAVGKADIIFPMIGVIFFTTALKPSTTLSHKPLISASELPNPVIRFCNADLSELIEPVIVYSASFAVVPVIPICVWMIWIASTMSA